MKYSLLTLLFCLIFNGLVVGQEKAVIDKAKEADKMSELPTILSKEITPKEEKTTKKAIKKAEKKLEKAVKKPNSKAKEKDIRKLLKITGSEKLAKQNFELMLRQLKLAFYQVPTTFWDGFEEKAEMNQITELIVPIYAKHFTHEEVKDLVKFYNTSLGKKLIEKTPLIQQESMKAGQKWGEDLSKEVLEEIETYKKENKEK